MKKLIKFLSNSRLCFVLCVVLYFVVVIGLPVWFLAKPVKKILVKLREQKIEKLLQIKNDESKPIKKKV